MGTAQTFGALHIDRRVLTTPSRTIVIESVATISVGAHIEHRPRLLLWIAVSVLAMLAFTTTQIGFAAQGSVNYASIVLAVLAAGLAVYALKPDDKTHYLLIATNDGAMSRFPAADRVVLEEVRRLLTDKINASNEGATYNVNFETGVIENLSVVARGMAETVGAPHPANGAAARSGAQSSQPAARTAAAHPNRAAFQNGGAPAIPEKFVDYTEQLPAVVEMYRFYARQSNAQHLEQRLSELELLMRAGAQTRGQKSRVRELTKELSQILQAYQPAVQIFQQISGMAA